MYEAAEVYEGEEEEIVEGVGEDIAGGLFTVNRKDGVGR